MIRFHGCALQGGVASLKPDEMVSANLMQRIVVLLLSCFCGGCIPIPYDRSISDRPPFDVVKGKVVVTKEVTYLWKKAQESKPEPGYVYFLAEPLPPRIHLDDSPKFVLPGQTKLRVTSVYRRTFLLGPPGLDILRPRNFLGATIVSGPYAGTEVSYVWSYDIDRLPDVISNTR